jgi:hydroxyacylglutathione hydrolase
VFIAGFPAGSWGTNCYIIAREDGEQCIIVDPGQDAQQDIDDIVRTHRLHPAAVIVTHGHIDHVWSVVPVCGARDIPAFIHPLDRSLLSDPGSGLGLPVGHPIFGGLTFSEPADVQLLTDGSCLSLAGLELWVTHTPGHTPGSVTFRTDRDGSEPATLLSGDLLFAGSIGRTDLPGGDYPTILRSLASSCLPLDDETVVLPGHGPRTTIGRERAANPYLAEAIAPPVTRGL